MVVIVALERTGYDTSDAASAKEALSVRAWITKPFQPTNLIEAVNKLCPI